jgi:hypothetical protein
MQFLVKKLVFSQIGVPYFDVIKLLICPKRNAIETESSTKFFGKLWGLQHETKFRSLLFLYFLNL